jgi:hypothetical protein
MAISSVYQAGVEVSTLEHCDVVFKSKQIRDPEDAQFFFIGEDHTNLASKKHTAEFIKKRLSPENILLVESIAYTKGLIKNQGKIETLLERAQLDLSDANQFFIMGWDSSNIKSILKLLNEIDEKIAPERSQYLSVYNKSKAGEEVSEEEREKASSAIRLVSQLADKRKLLAKITFPERTQSMVETVQKIKLLIDSTQFKGKVFLIAGADHLQTSKKEQNDPDYSLSEFYKSIADLNAVVLIPKDILINRLPG